MLWSCFFIKKPQDYCFFLYFCKINNELFEKIIVIL